MDEVSARPVNRSVKCIQTMWVDEAGWWDAIAEWRMRPWRCRWGTRTGDVVCLGSGAQSIAS